MELLNTIHPYRKTANSYTHVSLYPRAQAYYLEPEVAAQFYDDYCAWMYDDAHASTIGVGEHVPDVCPVFVDIDLSRALRPLEDVTGPFAKLYTPEQVLKVVQIYHALFRNLMQLETHEYLAVILEKEPGFRDGRIKSGLHIQFPYVVLHRSAQKAHILPIAKQQVDALFGENSLDQSVIDTSWLLYGSQKSETSGAYIATRYLDVDGYDISIDEAFAQFPLQNALGHPIARVHPSAYYLPYYLSISQLSGRRVHDIAIDLMDSALVRQMTAVRIGTLARDEQTLPGHELAENLVKARELIPMLAARRASDYMSWMKVGWALHNSCGPTRLALELWLEFSRKTTLGNFDEMNCIRLWQRMTPGKLTIASLMLFAKEDSPKEFAEFCARDENHFLIQAVNSLTDSDAAQLHYSEYGDIFRWTGTDWYKFNGVYWERSVFGPRPELRSHIEPARALLRKTTTRRRQLEEQIDGSADDDEEGRGMRRRRNNSSDSDETQNEIKKLKGFEKAICEFIKNLKTSGCKNNIMNECKELFYDAHFVEKLDNNPDIIAFRNGVYELKTHVFRIARPDDYFSRTMNVEYHDLDPYDPCVLRCHTFMQELFPNREVRRYFMRTLATMFVGGNKDKCFYVWSGNGNNGKTVMNEILLEMFGSALSGYMQTPAVQVITEKDGKAQQADPIMARTQGVRVLSLVEPSKEDRIIGGKLKKLTGNDRYVARDLFQRGADMREITPMFKVILSCNDLPRIYNGEPALWNRIRVILFERKFVTRAELPTDPAEAEQKKLALVNPEFNTTDRPHIVQGLPWLLLQILKEIQKEGMGPPPQMVLVATQSYRQANDLVAQFIEDTYERASPSDMTSISVKDIWKQFTAWYRDMNPESKTRVSMTRPEFQVQLTCIWGEPNHGLNRYRGYCLRARDDDD